MQLLLSLFSYAPIPLVSCRKLRDTMERQGNPRSDWKAELEQRLISELTGYNENEDCEC